MHRSLLALAAACAAIVTPPLTGSAKADVYVTRGARVYYAPRPFRPWLYRPVYAAPVAVAPYYAPYAPACATRVVRVWTGAGYIARRVTRCW